MLNLYDFPAKTDGQNEWLRQLQIEDFSKIKIYQNHILILPHFLTIFLF